jgi:GWxTD domain-containing protein
MVFRHPLHVVFPAILALLLSLLLIRCAGSSSLDSTASSKTVAYVPGIPNFDLEVLATWRDGAPGVEVLCGIPYRSLTFLRAGQGFVAVYQTTILVTDRESQKQVLEKDWVDSVAVAGYDVTQMYNRFSEQKRLALEPGSYGVEVAIRDANSGKRAVRGQKVDVPVLEPGRPKMSRIWLEAPGAGKSFEPLVFLHIPENLDSLRASVMVYSLEGAREVYVRWTIARVRSDTSVATPPFGYTASTPTIAHKGMDLEQRDTVAEEEQLLSSLQHEMTLHLSLPKLTHGMYVMGAQVRGRFGEITPDTFLVGAMFLLSVKSANFPRPSTLDALIEALSYIAKEDELPNIRSAPTPQELRRQFELFWLRLAGSQQAAANLIRQYYTRIEEANLLFTTYKEGWKTDMGMVYTILGPPMSVGSRMDNEIWSYSYDERDPLSILVFERVADVEFGSSFPTIVLVRQPYYSAPWARAVQRWRSGSVP